MQKKTRPWRILVARVKCGYRANGPLDEDTLFLFSRAKSFASGFFSLRTANVSPPGFFLIVRVISFPWDIHGNENEKVSIRKTGDGISREKGGKHAGSIAGNKLERERA